MTSAADNHPTPDTKPGASLRVVDTSGLKGPRGKGLAVGDEVTLRKVSDSGLVNIFRHGGWFRAHRFEVIG